MLYVGHALYVKFQCYTGPFTSVTQPLNQIRFIKDINMLGRKFINPLSQKEYKHNLCIV